MLVFGEENGQAIIYEYNSPPVDVIKRQIDDVAGCLVKAALFQNTWFALPHRFVLSLYKLDTTTNVQKNISSNFSWINCSLQFEENIDLLQVVVFFSLSVIDSL